MKTGRWQTGPWGEAGQPYWTSECLGDLVLVTAPTAQIITVPEMRLYLRLDEDNTAEDGLLGDLIEMAIDFCEKAISGHVQLRTAVYDVPVRCWWGGELSMPRHPLQSVGSIKYLDYAGVQQTLLSTLYIVRAPWRAPGQITLNWGSGWPGYQGGAEFPVVIRFTAGYANGKCPPTVKQAIRLLVTQAYWQRCPVEEAVTDTIRRLLDLEGMRYR